LEGNDWLKLSARATSGGSIYGLRPQNVIGYIEISARDNNNLKEKTDREGFMESPYSNNFFQITSKVRDEIDLVLEKTRRSYNEFRKYVAVENVGINDAKSTFQNLKKTAKDSQRILKSSTGLEIKLYQLKDDLAEIETNLHGDKSNRLVKELLPKIEAQIQEAADLVIELKKLVESTARLDDYIDYLQPQIQSLETQLKDFTELAALGLTAEALSHELANIVDRLNRLTTKASKFKHTNREYTSEMSLFINDVKNIVGSFRKQLSHLDPALNYVRESKDEFSLKAFIKETIDFYEENYDNKIYLTATLSSNDFKLRVNKGRMVQILDNLILNSGYWLTRKKEINPSFDPTINFEINYPFLRISDNGLGIDKSIENTLFQPFVTTKPTKSGRGLGLFIVQQLLDSISCTISLLPNRNSSGNRYIFQLNLASLIIEE